MRQYRAGVSLLLLMLISPLGWLSGGAAAREVDFSRDVRPILSSTCNACHGPDGEHREADLRLDTRDGIFGERDTGTVVVPGSSATSELYRRISHTDPYMRMPPVDSGKELTAEQIETIRLWIDQGAEWSSHWAFDPPQRPEIPQVSNGTNVANPVDAFVMARLESAGLEPEPLADKAILLRRLSLDLIGLPPTLDELDAFLADDHPDAYARQVERLLRSPHYGERWGRIWLDAARYADSDGFEKDKPRSVWMYRDWVVQALNDDLPYDQFIIQQIAGDLLPNADQNSRVATGFLRNSMINEEGGIDPEQFRMEAMFDRMDAVGKSILGLTIQCAQCHTHKYDPLTHTDYYRMFAFLNNSHEANITVYPDHEYQARREILSRIGAIEDQLKQQMPKWRENVLAWAEHRRAKTTTWHVMELENAGDNGQRYFPQPDGSILALGYAPTRFDAQFHAHTELPVVRAFRLELLTDPNLPAGGPGRSIDGLMALTEFHVDVPKPDRPEERERIRFQRAVADYGNPEKTLGSLYADRSGKARRTGPVEFAIDGDHETAWGIDAGPGRRNQPRQAIFVAEKEIALPQGAPLLVTLSQHHGGWNSDDNQNMNLGRFRISVTSQLADAEDEPPLPPRIEQLLARDSATWDRADWNTLFSHWRTTVAQWKSENETIEALWRDHPAGTTQLVLQEREVRRPTYRLERGDFLKRAELVEPGTPEFLHPLQPSGDPARLDFARWLVDRNSPTTARAMVNRVWQAYFGTGLVATSEDLGMQGEAPTHPKLLDWLSVEWMENGWSLKHLHRLIVHSYAYRQSSRVTPEKLEQDPYNLLISRGPRFRVDAELIRDSALFASGLLNRQVGGPSVYPPAPDFLFLPPVSYGPKPWPTSTGPDKYRRAIYTFRFRSILYPALQVFDAPNGDFACVRRSRSNTPLQALTLLNEPLFIECAQSLAHTTLSEAEADTPSRIGYAFRRCVSRWPQPHEITRLAEFYQTAREQLAKADPADVEALASFTADERPELPDGISELDRAAWTAVCRVILNLDEMVTKE